MLVRRSPAMTAVLMGFFIKFATPSLSYSDPSSSGDALFAEGKFAQARVAYATAAKREPKNVELLLNEIRTLLRLDKDYWREAITVGRKAVTVAPRNAEAHGLYALALMRGGRPDDAAHEAKQALEISENSYYGLVAAGRVALWNEKKNEAGKVLRRAVDLHPDRPDAYYYLFSALDAKDRSEAVRLAKAYYRLAPKGHPHDRAIDALQNTRDYQNADKADKQEIASKSKSADSSTKETVDNGNGKPVVYTFPIERNDEDIILPVTVNGVRFRLLFDTGAGADIALDEAAVSRLNIKPVGQTLVSGVSGYEKSKIYRVDTVEIGPRTLHNVRIGSMIKLENQKIDGLVGGAVFQDSAVTVDFKENTMTLAQGKNAMAPPVAPENHIMTVPFHNLKGYIIVPLRLADRTETEWGMLDTGAQGLGVLSLITARDLAKKLYTNQDDISSVEITVNQRLGVGTTSPSFTALLFRFAVDLAFVHNSGTPFFMELQPIYGASMIDEFVSRSYDFHLSAIVGISYLTSAQRVTFDYPHHLLTMEFVGTPH